MLARHLTVIAAAAAISMVAASRSDLTGTWTLSAGQSRFGTMTPVTSMKMTVTEKGKLLTIEESIVGPGYEKAAAYECKFDNRFHPVVGGDQGTILCKWDGSSLVRDHQWNDGRNEEKIRMMPAPDGSLVEEIAVTSPSGADNRTLVWKRS